MYKSLVRSHLDYCDIIYHQSAIINPPLLGLTLTTLMKEVEKIQYQAALTITGSWQCSSRTKLYEELGWETLSDRRSTRRILHVPKIENNKTPSYLKNKLPARRAGNAVTYQKINCRIDRYMNSFFPDATSSWNIVIRNFPNMPSFSTLKSTYSHFFVLSH